jgi:pyrroline-5-carboxylate reductase
MPNTPTMVGAGMAAASMGTGVTEAQKKFVLGFLAATGKVIEVAEDLQDAVTATSGSGPAYFFAFVEAMVAGAKDLGLSEEEIVENEQQWREERDEPELETTQGQDLRSIGITPAGLESDITTGTELAGLGAPVEPAVDAGTAPGQQPVTAVGAPPAPGTVPPA